jgi:hypothetical protein
MVNTQYIFVNGFAGFVFKPTPIQRSYDAAWLLNGKDKNGNYRTKAG